MRWGVNAIIGFVQEYRAGKAIEALAAMIPEFATALRDDQSIAVPAEKPGPRGPCDPAEW